MGEQKPQSKGHSLGAGCGDKAKQLGCWDYKTESQSGKQPAAGKGATINGYSGAAWKKGCCLDGFEQDDRQMDGAAGTRLGDFIFRSHGIQ